MDCWISRSDGRCKAGKRPRRHGVGQASNGLIPTASHSGASSMCGTPFVPQLQERILTQTSESVKEGPQTVESSGQEALHLLKRHRYIRAHNIQHSAELGA